MKTLLFATLLSCASANITEMADWNQRLRKNWLPDYINCSDNGHPNVADPTCVINTLPTAEESQLSISKYEGIMLIKSALDELIDKLDVDTNKCGIYRRRSDSFNSCQSVECQQNASVIDCSMPKFSSPRLRLVILANQSKKYIHLEGLGRLFIQFIRIEQIELLLCEENSYLNRFHVATESEHYIHYTPVDYNTDRSREEDSSLQSVIFYACISVFMLVYISRKHCFATVEGLVPCLKCVNIVLWILCSLYPTCTSDLMDRMLLRYKNILDMLTCLWKIGNNNIEYVFRDVKLLVGTEEAELCSAAHMPFSIQEDCFMEQSCDAQTMEAAENVCGKAQLRDHEGIHPVNGKTDSAEQDVDEYQSLQGKPSVHNVDIEDERKYQQHLQLIDDAYGTEAEVASDVQVQISDDFHIEQMHESVERKAYVPSKDEEILFEAAILQAATNEELEELDIEQNLYYDELDHSSEGISTDDTHFVTEICKDTAGELDFSVLIPDAQLGASLPLKTNEELHNAVPPKPGKKTSMLKVKVVPNPPQNFTQQSDVTFIQNQTHFTSQIKNLKYKVKEDSYKPVDCTVEEGELETISALRDCTWLPLNELPVPMVEIIVAHVPQFEPLMEIIDQISNGTPPTPHITMRYELLRFCTYRSYPKEDKPYVITLAAAGFYYASDGDGVVCYSCGVRRYNWTSEDNPMKIHKRINPNCKFLIKNEEVNIPVKYFGPFSESLMYIDSIPDAIERPVLSEDFDNDWAPERIRSPVPKPQNIHIEATTNSLGISTAIPKHSQYATKTAREASYNGWPDSSSHTPRELADAGYFFAGFGDCVRCFFCGIGLRHWTNDDNPWIEHARWSQTCVFLKQKKGEEFVNLVQMAVQNSQDNVAQSSASSGNQLPAQEIEKFLLSDAAQSVLEMGYQPKIIKNAIEQILRHNGHSKISAQMLMEKVLEIEEAENLTKTSSVSTPTMPVSQSAKAEAQSAKLVDNKSTTSGQSAAKTDKVKKDDKSAKTSPAETNNRKKDEEGSLNDNDKEHKAKTASKEVSEVKLQDPKSIKAENEQLKEQTLCKVCLDNTVCIVFLPCGHLVTCADCAPAMRKCPICRALVKGTVRTYMS